MHLRPIPAVTVLIATVLVLAGCQNQTLPPSPGLADPVPAPYSDTEIQVLDAELRPWLGFQTAAVTASDSKPMLVEIPVRNQSDRNWQVNYRFIFYDADGMQVRPVMAWRRAVLRERQVVTFGGGANDTTAVRYKLEVTWAQ